MDKNNLIQMTNSLYRLTLLFPKKEPLRYKMREIADEVLDKCLRENSGQNPVTDDLEVLDGFFGVAKEQSWVQTAELLKIQEEYNKIKAETRESSKAVQEVPKLLEKPKKEITESRPVQPAASAVSTINPRQEKIMEFLRENGRAQVWQVKQIFPEVTKRTIRRDFESMLKQRVIERVGERNDTFYQVPRLTKPGETKDETKFQ